MLASALPSVSKLDLWSGLSWQKKNKTGTWLSEQMGRNLGTVSRWMTNKVQPSVEQLYDIAKHLDVDVRDLLVASK